MKTSLKDSLHKCYQNIYQNNLTDNFISFLFFCCLFLNDKYDTKCYCKASKFAKTRSWEFLKFILEIFVFIFHNLCRGVFRTLSNIEDGAFCENSYCGELFSQNAPSWMFNRVLNMTLIYILQLINTALILIFEFSTIYISHGLLVWLVIQNGINNP